MANLMNDAWQLLGSQPVGEHFVFKLRHDRYRATATGKELTFVVMESVDWVNVVPVTRDGLVVLVWQYRHGVRAPSLEIPGGMIDHGELPEAGARRELREETGYDAGRLTHLGAVWPNPAIQDNTCHFYLAHDVEPAGELMLDDGEAIQVVTVPVAEIPERVAKGEIRHALVLNALAMAGLLPPVVTWPEKR